MSGQDEYSMNICEEIALRLIKWLSSVELDPGKMVSFKGFQTFLFWAQVVLGVWQIIKHTPVGVFVRALLWSVAHVKPPFVRKNLLLVGVSNSVYATTNNESHGSFKKGKFSITYEYAHLGHLAHVTVGSSQQRTYHFEEPELYDSLLGYLERDAPIYMDEGIFIFGISKFKPLTALQLCNSVLIERKNCMYVDSRLGIIVDKAQKMESDYFLQTLALFNIACNKLTVVTAFTTLLYVVLDRWHWAYKQLLAFNNRIAIFITRKLLHLLPPASKLKIYLSLDPYFPNVQPSNFVSEVAKQKIRGQFLFLPNNRFDGFKLGHVMNADRDELYARAGRGSFGFFAYEVQDNQEEETGLFQTRVRLSFCDIVTVDRMYRWPLIKVRVLKLILAKICEVGVGPITSVKKGVAHVCKPTELLDYIERKGAWVAYIGLLEVYDASLD